MWVMADFLISKGYGILKGDFVMVRVCVFGNENERKFRTVCNDILHEIWADFPHYSRREIGYEFRDRVQSAYSEIMEYTKSVSMRYNYSVFGMKPKFDGIEVSMDMVRKVFAEL